MKTQHLSPPTEREDRHNRQVSCHGYARKDVKLKTQLFA